MTMSPAAAVTAANDRILAPLRAARAHYYTLASAAIAEAGGVSAVVAFNDVPADARARMVAAARTFCRRTRSDRQAARAVEGLAEAMLAWNLVPEATALSASVGYALPEAVADMA